MHQRVQRDATRKPGRRIAELIRHPGVCGLVDGDGNQECQDGRQQGHNAELEHPVDQKDRPNDKPEDVLLAQALLRFHVGAIIA